ncbi:MAG: hemL, partial [Bacilli bacterium]|nr:hemL [Bacilli bacterium]
MASEHNGFSKSGQEYARAKKVIPGGVNSPVRAFRAVGGDPVFVKSGSGAYFEDIDGNRYLDYVLSWGPLILGHAHPEVVAAVKRAACSGTSFGAPTILETEMAELVCSIVPSMEIVRMVSSGTEATMSALRLARGFTGRTKIVKFEGCYHGHADSLLIKAGSGVATFSLPDSPGVPDSVAAETVTVPYNDIAALEQAFQLFGEEIAAVIIEPIAGNMGFVAPLPGYLQQVRQITKDAGSLLIFDEVMTGFRAAYGGAQALYDITPDLTTLGKVIGGGLPVGAYGGRRDIMELVAPTGPVYQAGTLSGNPLAMAAGLTTLQILGQPGVYERMEAMARQLVEGFKQAGYETGIAVTGDAVGGMFGCFFHGDKVTDYQSAKRSDLSLFARYFH